MGTLSRGPAGYEYCTAREELSSAIRVRAGLDRIATASRPWLGSLLRRPKAPSSGHAAPPPRAGASSAAPEGPLPSPPRRAPLRAGRAAPGRSTRARSVRARFPAAREGAGRPMKRGGYLQLGRWRAPESDCPWERRRPFELSLCAGLYALLIDMRAGFSILYQYSSSGLCTLNFDKCGDIVSLSAWSLKRDHPAGD